MRLDDNIPVQPQKLENLRLRIARLGLNLAAVEESFVRGRGKGGQKINKTANVVVLRYPAMNLVVKCQRERERSINRFLALRELVDRIEMQMSPATSQKLQDRGRIRRQKDRRRRRAGQ